MKRYPRPLSKGEAALAQQLKAMGIEFRREVVFAPPRRWRLDFVLDGKIAVEVEGGIYSKGRHTRASGFIGDMEKYNTATALGYRVFRFSTVQAVKGEALSAILDILKIGKN